MECELVGGGGGQKIRPFDTDNHHTLHKPKNLYDDLVIHTITVYMTMAMAAPFYFHLFLFLPFCLVVYLDTDTSTILWPCGLNSKRFSVIKRSN